MSSTDDQNSQPTQPPTESNRKRLVRSREERRKRILKSSADRLLKITNYPEPAESKIQETTTQDVKDLNNDNNNIEKKSDDEIEAKKIDTHNFFNDEEDITEFWNKNEIQSKIADLSEQKIPKEKPKASLFNALFVFLLGIITCYGHLFDKWNISTLLLFILISIDFIRTRYKVTSIKVLIFEYIRNIHHDILLFLFGYISFLMIGQFYAK